MADGAGFCLARMALRLEHRVPPPLVGACVAALMLAIAWVSPALDLRLPWRVPLAIVLAAIGAALDVIGMVYFLRARTTFNPLEPQSASALVTGGVFRLTRNPMYLGMAIMLAGWAIYLSNLAAFAGVPLFVAYINRFQIAPEERALAKRFGAQFDAYRARVRRWF